MCLCCCCCSRRRKHFAGLMCMCVCLYLFVDVTLPDFWAMHSLRKAFWTDFQFILCSSFFFQSPDNEFLFTLLLIVTLQSIFSQSQCRCAEPWRVKASPRLHDGTITDTVYNSLTECWQLRCVCLCYGCVGVCVGVYVLGVGWFSSSFFVFN